MSRQPEEPNPLGLGPRDREGSNTGSVEDTHYDAVADDPWLTEEPWWKARYATRPYARDDRGFEYYARAYRYGIDAAHRHHGRIWPEVEPELARGWDAFRGTSGASWPEIVGAVKDAWDRETTRVRSGVTQVDRALPPEGPDRRR